MASRIRASRFIDVDDVKRRLRKDAEALFAVLTAPQAEPEPEKKILRGQLPNGTPYPLVYRWSRNGRHGQACRIVAREKKEIMIEFADGFQMLASRGSVKRG